MMSALLMSFLTMFTTSCVQGDLFDELYEDSDGMYLPRKKKGLDYNGPSAQELNAAQSYVNSGSFSPTENECFACALYNYSVVEQQNKTPYQMREYVGKAQKGIILSLTRQILFLLPLIILLPYIMGIDGIMYAGPCADLAAALLSIYLVVKEVNILKQKEAIHAQ